MDDSTLEGMLHTFIALMSLSGIDLVVICVLMNRKNL